MDLGFPSEIGGFSHAPCVRETPRDRQLARDRSCRTTHGRSSNFSCAPRAFLRAAGRSRSGRPEAVITRHSSSGSRPGASRGSPSSSRRARAEGRRGPDVERACRPPRSDRAGGAMTDAARERSPSADFLLPVTIDDAPTSRAHPAAWVGDAASPRADPAATLARCLTGPVGFGSVGGPSSAGIVAAAWPGRDRRRPCLPRVGGDSIRAECRSPRLDRSARMADRARRIFRNFSCDKWWKRMDDRPWHL